MKERAEGGEKDGGGNEERGGRRKGRDGRRGRSQSLRIVSSARTPPGALAKTERERDGRDKEAKGELML